MFGVKKRLTRDEEFQIMKLVLDKFLWLGFGVMIFGMYLCFAQDLVQGIAFVISGAVMLVLFLILIVREYEIIS
jgi:hypothetical protein